jgi:hypothetical protein
VTAGLKEKGEQGRKKWNEKRKIEKEGNGKKGGRQEKIKMKKKERERSNSTQLTMGYKRLVPDSFIDLR